MKSYDDWLALSSDQKHETKLSWDAYEREAIGIPIIASGRLALNSDRKVIATQIGTYHGGEYLIHAIVSDEDFKSCPPMLEDQFEGFRIIWLPVSKWGMPQ